MIREAMWPMKVHVAREPCSLISSQKVVHGSCKVHRTEGFPGVPLLVVVGTVPARKELKAVSGAVKTYCQ